MALTQTAIQLAQSKEVLLDLDKQVMEELQTQTVNLKNATEQLMAQLMSWEQRYLLKSPINGKVTFLSVWSPNQNVESGASVFVVVPMALTFCWEQQQKHLPPIPHFDLDSIRSER